MSDIEIKKVQSKSELTKFSRFNYHLYKDCPYAVPEFYDDTMECFDKKKNAAFDFCECDWFLAYRDGEIVGRVCAIINHRANETWNVRNVRFGWIDFIEDERVARLLIDTVEQWGRERGMDTIVGPLGYTDMDPEGMLIDGFDELGTMSTIYNYPYYPQFIQKMGFEKDADWIERLVTIPTKENPAHFDKFFKIGDIVSQRCNLRPLHFNNTAEIIDGGWGMKMFHLINRAYAPLYGYSQLTDRQCNQYVQKYLPFVDVHSVVMIVNEKEDLVAIGIGMPSLSRAIQKAKGKLFPFGWWHLVKSIYLKKYSDILDLLLIAVAPEYQGRGVNAVVFADMMRRVDGLGFKYAAVHPILEDNTKSAEQWKYVDFREYRTRRCWKKPITDNKQ